MKYLILMVSLFFTNALVSQKISYSDIEKEDSRNMNVEIVGKFGDKVIVYKNARAENFFSVYNADLSLKEKIKLVKLPTKIINSDFVSYGTHFFMIYQHQKKSVVYCEAYKFDSNGKLMNETPILLDTTTIPNYANDNKIYNIQLSDNKQRIAVFKGNKKNDKIHSVGVVLFDNNLNKIYKKFLSVAMDGRNNYLDEFTVDNEGGIYFARCYSNSNNDYVSKFDIVAFSEKGDSVQFIPVLTEDKSLDEIILKVDNQNKKLIAQSFYFTKRRGNVEGLMAAYYTKNSSAPVKPLFTKFSDSFKIEAKGINNIKMAFNDFFIREMFLKKDGSYILTAESYTDQARNGTGQPWNRFDYFGGSPSLTSYDYYNMGNRNWYWNSWDRPGQGITYIAENVAVMNFDKNGNLTWTNVVHKDQRDDGLESFLSYQVMLTGGALHFIFNERDRSDFLLSDNSVSPNGIVTRHPTLRNLNRQYQLMPRFSKQISAKEIIIPCVYKNYICFAKLEF